MTSYDQMQECERKVSKTLAAARDQINRIFAEYPISPRLKAIARKMANDSSGGYGDELTVGYPGQMIAFVDTKNKNLPCIFYTSVHPLWVWYLSDAQAAIDLVEFSPESGG